MPNLLRFHPERCPESTGTGVRIRRNAQRPPRPPQPAGAVQDRGQRSVEVVGAQPAGLGFPQEPGGQTVRVLDQQRAAATRLDGREAEQVQQRLFGRPNVVAEPAALDVPVVATIRSVEAGEGDRLPSHLLGRLPPVWPHQQVDRGRESDSMVAGPRRLPSRPRLRSYEGAGSWPCMMQPPRRCTTQHPFSRLKSRETRAQVREAADLRGFRPQIRLVNSGSATRGSAPHTAGQRVRVAHTMFYSCATMKRQRFDPELLDDHDPFEIDDDNQPHLAKHYPYCPMTSFRRGLTRTASSLPPRQKGQRTGCWSHGLEPGWSRFHWQHLGMGGGGDAGRSVSTSPVPPWSLSTRRICDV